MESDLFRDILNQAFGSAELPIHGFVDLRSLREATSTLSEQKRGKYGVNEAQGAVVAALPYGEGPVQEPDWARGYPGPRARLARFARANWYGELVSRLKKASAFARAGLAAAGYESGAAESWRCLANSGLPEKPLAVRAGLGKIGRHGLVIVDGAGPACVLGVLLLPFDPSSSAWPSTRFETLSGRPGDACGSCRACIDACPTGALGADGGYDRLRCLQHWSIIAEGRPSFIEKAWGERLYGCDVCLEACPYFKLDPGAHTELGRLGPGLPLSWLVSASDAEIRARLRGSALGLGWIPPAALRANAELASRHAI
jgi:epoxyqueuosine reductase